MSKTSSAVKNAWMAENYDRVSIMIKKGERERLKSAAAIAGVSVSRYVIDAVNTYAGEPLLSVLDDESKRRKEVTKCQQ